MFYPINWPLRVRVGYRETPVNIRHHNGTGTRARLGCCSHWRLRIGESQKGENVVPMDNNNHQYQESQFLCSSSRKKDRAKNGRIIESQKSRKDYIVKATGRRRKNIQDTLLWTRLEVPMSILLVFSHTFCGWMDLFVDSVSGCTSA